MTWVEVLIKFVGLDNHPATTADTAAMGAADGGHGADALAPRRVAADGHEHQVDPHSSDAS